MEHIASKNIAGAISAFHTALTSGREPKVFLLLSITKVRSLLLLRFAPEMKKELQLQYSDTDFEFLTELVGAKGVAINSQLLAELLTALIEMNRAPIPAIPLELALYRVLGEGAQTSLL